MKTLAVIAAFAVSACAQQNQAEWELDVLLNIGAKPPLPHWNRGGTSFLWQRVEELLNRTLPEAEIHAEAAAWLMTELVRAGQDVRGFRIHADALARMSHLPDHHPRILRMLEAKAAALHETRRFRLSAAMRERIAAARRDGPKDLFHRARFDLAIDYRLSGQLDRAEAILQELHREAAEGVRFSDIQDELGLVLDALGRTAEADIVRDGRERPVPPPVSRGNSCFFGTPPPLDIFALADQWNIPRPSRTADPRTLIETLSGVLRASYSQAGPEKSGRDWSVLTETALRHGLPAVAERVLREQIEVIETHRGPDSPSLDGPHEVLAKLRGAAVR